MKLYFFRTGFVDLHRDVPSVFCPQGSDDLVQLVHIAQPPHQDARQIHSHGWVEEPPTLTEYCATDLLVAQLEESRHESTSSHHVGLISKIITQQQNIGKLDGLVAFATLEFLDYLRMLLHNGFQICAIERVPHALLFPRRFWILPKFPLHETKHGFPSRVQP